MIDKFKELIKNQYNTDTNQYKDSELFSKLGFDINIMKSSGYDSSIIEEHSELNRVLKKFIHNNVIGKYLKNLIPNEIYLASGVRILTIEQIKEECFELSPGCFIFKYGYMPFATSIGGYQLCFGLQNERIFWADLIIYEYNDELLIEYFNKEKSEYEDSILSADVLLKALVHLSNNFWEFFTDLLAGKHEKLLDNLDSGLTK